MTTERIDIVVREDGSRVVKRNLQDIGTAADETANSLDLMKGILTGLIAGGIITGLIRMADTYTTIQNRLRLVTTGTENLARVTKELQGIANDTRTDFEATTELYSRLASSAKELGVSQDRLLRFTKTLNQAIVLSGATAEEAAGGLRQLSQGMASGVLRGDELNSVMENFPKVADIIAQGLGVTRGELRKLGAEGKITATTIIDAFAEAEKAVNEDFGKTVPTISQAFTVLKNNLLIAVGEFDQANGISKAFAEMLVVVANNLNVIIPIIVGIGTSIAIAFSVEPLMKFGNALKTLYAVAMANPWIALATIIAGLIVTLVLMRDEIKLGIDETTTLGDLMRAAWETVGPAITAVADLAAQFFSWLTNTSAGTFEQLIDDIVGYEHQNESTWFKILRIVIQVFDMIGGTIRGTFMGIIASGGVMVEQLSNQFNRLADMATAAVSGDWEGVKKIWDEAGESVDSLGSRMASAFGDAFKDSALSQADSGLEALLDQWVARAQEIGKARDAAKNASSPLAGASGVVGKPTIDEDAAKKAAKELERLKNALDNVLDAANPVEAAQRRLAEAQEILNKAVAAGLIDQQKAKDAYSNLSDMMRDQLDPLAAINRHLDENISLLKLSNEQRQIEADMMNFTEQLRRDGVKLTQEEVAALRAKLTVEQELARISQYRDSMEGNSSAGQMREFMAQIEAFKQFSQQSTTNDGDRFNALQQMLPWANLENTQAQMQAYVQLHADMYAQIKELENQGVIDHQTAEMLKAQADVQYMENRLSYQRKFFGLLAGLASSENKKIAAIGKAAAVTQAVIDGVLAVQKTMAETPYPYNIPLAAAQGALAAANVAQIMSQSTGFRTGGTMTVGGTGGPDSQMVAFRATPGEQVQVNTPSQARALERAGEGGSSKPVNLQVAVVDDRQKISEWARTPDGQEAILHVIELNPERVAAVSGAV